MKPLPVRELTQTVACLSKAIFTALKAPDWAMLADGSIEFHGVCSKAYTSDPTNLEGLSLNGGSLSNILAQGSTLATSVEMDPILTGDPRCGRNVGVQPLHPAA